jgi:hypothetical protein
VQSLQHYSFDLNRCQVFGKTIENLSYPSANRIEEESHPARVAYRYWYNIGTIFTDFPVLFLARESHTELSPRDENQKPYD